MKITVAVLILVATSQVAFSYESLNGFIEITRVDSEVNGVARGTFRQQYTAHWQRSIVPNVKLRASFRYLKFDVDIGQFPGFATDEYQPSGELVWKQRLFVFGVSGRRRSADLLGFEGRQNSDNVALTFGTRDTRFPLISARFDWGHTFDTREDPARDSKEKRYELSLDHFVEGQAFTYSFSRRLTDNVISNVSSTKNVHLFRWTAEAIPLGRNVRVTSNYTLSHRFESDRRISDEERFLSVISGGTGLYAETPDSTFGELSPVPALTDGDQSTPTEPPIDISGVSRGQSIGIDLGFRSPVRAIYLYVDGPSDPATPWTVLVSRENLSWQTWTSNPAVAFNTTANRYEILFDSTITRYIKVFKSGLNTQQNVLVTEIEALRELGGESSQTRRGNTHLVDVGLTYRSGRKLTGTMDGSFERRPFLGTSGEGRDRGDYAVGLRYAQHHTLSHHARWQQGFQLFDAEGGTQKTSTWSYSLRYIPMETLGVTTSVTGRLEHRDNKRTDDVTSAVLQVTGRPIPGLNMSAEAARSQNEEIDIGRVQDVSSYRVSFDGFLTRALEAVATYSHQQVDVALEGFGLDDRRKRDLYSLDLNYRFTRTIFARGSLNFVNDRRNSFTQDYLLSWNATPKVTVGGQAFFTDESDETRTARYNSSVAYDLGSRSNLFFSYANSDFTEAGGAETKSVQFGFRTGF